MFSESVELYDLVYGAFKDYAAEADYVAAQIRSRSPEARRVLDVACGTGEHARHLVRRHGFDVFGVDIEPAFVDIARRKVPEAQFETGDMRGLDLGSTFDAVLCLFSSIGYVGGEPGLAAALDGFRRHSEPGGLCLLEPWLTPGRTESGFVSIRTAESDTLQVCRMSHTEVVGSTSVIRFEYMVGTADGIRRASEVHELTLFTERQMHDAFRAAGFEVEHDPQGLTGRGLWIGRAAAPAG